MNPGWQVKNLSDLSTIIAGQSPEGRFYNSDGVGLPFYQGKKEFGERFLGTPSTWTTSYTKIAEKDDILMSVRAPVGPVNFSTQKICIGRGLAAIRTNSLLDRDFLFYQLLYLQPSISGRDGAVFPAITKTQIDNISIAFPSLTEQQRIVSILERAFESFKQLELIYKTKVSCLNELKRSLLQVVFVDNNWQKKRLKDSSLVIAGQSPAGSSYNSGGNGIAFYQGKKEFTQKFIGPPTTWTTNPTKIALAGDILMSVRAPVGPVNFATSEICIGRGLASVRCKPELNREFLFYQFLFLQPQISGSEGAVFPSISRGQIENLLIVVPAISEQQRSVDFLDKAFLEIERLELLNQRQIQFLDELKRAFLHQAFSGQL